jgi:hypothetical protein
MGNPEQIESRGEDQRATPVSVCAAHVGFTLSLISFFGLWLVTMAQNWPALWIPAIVGVFTCIPGVFICLFSLFTSQHKRYLAKWGLGLGLFTCLYLPTIVHSLLHLLRPVN